MNKKFKKITGIVTTGALVLSLGTGAMVISNTTASATTIDEGVQTEAGRFAGGRRSERPEGMEVGERAERPERVIGEETGERGEKPGSGNAKREKKNFDFTILVEAELIGEDQLADIELLKDEKIVEREEEKALVEAMTDEERQTYFEEKAEEKPKLFDVLVEEGILDEAEAQAIESYLQEQRNIEKATMMTSKLEPLVTDGTLTSDDVESIIQHLKDLEPREKPVKGEEMVGRISPFDEMVSESIISEVQAEAIEELMNQTQRGRR